MNPFPKLYIWLAAAGSALLAVLGVYLKGRSAGKQVEQAKATKKELETERAKAEIVREATNAQVEIDRLPVDDVRERLRDKWQRD
jgi:hypothetical protein